MSLSTPKPQSKTRRSMNEMLQLPERQRNRGDVIINDWVPATQFSKMHHAEPVRRAGPLRPQWYLTTAKNLITRVLLSTRSAA